MTLFEKLYKRAREQSDGSDVGIYTELYKLAHDALYAKACVLPINTEHVTLNSLKTKQDGRVPLKSLCQSTFEDLKSNAPNKPRAGRPPEGDRRAVNLYLDTDTITDAEAIGEGSASEGIRQAVATIKSKRHLMSYFEADCEKYRDQHGKGSLVPYISTVTSQTYVAKSFTENEVVLVAIFGDEEKMVTPAEFSSEFLFYYQDDYVFHAGTPEQIKFATKLRTAIHEAMRFCLYNTKSNIGLGKQFNVLL